MPVNDSSQVAPADLVTVREAAQALGISVATISSWIRQGRVAVSPGPRGWLISVAAAQALAAPPHPATPADAVALYEAIRITGASPHRIVVWVKQGLLLSWRGPHGRLVRVADVRTCPATCRCGWPANAPRCPPDSRGSTARRRGHGPSLQMGQAGPAARLAGERDRATCPPGRCPGPDRAPWPCAAPTP